MERRPTGNGKAAREGRKQKFERGWSFLTIPTPAQRRNKLQRSNLSGSGARPAASEERAEVASILARWLVRLYNENRQ